MRERVIRGQLQTMIQHTRSKHCFPPPTSDLPLRSSMCVPPMEAHDVRAHAPRTASCTRAARTQCRVIPVEMNTRVSIPETHTYLLLLFRRKMAYWPEEVFKAVGSNLLVVERIVPGVSDTLVLARGEGPPLNVRSASMQLAVFNLQAGCTRVALVSAERSLCSKVAWLSGMPG